MSMEYPLDWEETDRMLRRFSSSLEKAELVWMSPREFLSKVPHPRGSFPAVLNLEEGFDRGSLELVEKAYRTGRPMEPLLLDYVNFFRGYPSHEGRHRALVALRLGVERVPVVVVRHRVKGE